MQGQKRAIGSLPEGLSFDHGSSSSGAGIDEQICWNSMRNSAQNRLSGYDISLSNSSDLYLNSAIQGQNLSGWNIGEASSSAAQNLPINGDRRAEHGWSSSVKASVGVGPSFDAQQYEPISMLRLDDGSVNLSRNQIANGPLFMQSSSSDSIPPDLNVNSSFTSHGVVEWRVMEGPDAFKPGSSDQLRLGSSGTSSDHLGALSGGSGGYLEETDSRPGCSINDRRLSGKRKALEVSIGQSSGTGSSSFFQPADSVWHTVPSRRNASSSLSISTPAEDSSLSEQIIPRLGLGVGLGSSENPIVLGSPGPVEGSRRNVRLRINSSHQQGAISANNVLPTGSSVGHANPAAVYPSSRLLSLNNNHVDLRSSAVATDNSSPSQSQSVLRVPALRRNMRSSRWNRSSNARATRSSSMLVSGERDTEPREEPNSRSMPRNISDHPIFVPATETRNSAQHGFTWSSTGGNVIAPGNLASSSQAGPSSGVQPSSAPNWAPQRSSPHYPRRLAELVRRSLLSSSDFEAGRGQASNVTPPTSGPSAPLQEGLLPSGAGNQGHHHHYHHLPHSRSSLLLDRHLDGAFGHPLRSLAGAGEGRSRLVSEIRNVLDLMRRGEGLRFEDFMLLDQSVFYGIADSVHDRHRDMRLDVDNMSYEELLALEERIGNVNTGLTEETISNRLKRRKYAPSETVQQDPEPCSICREEYNNGEDLGGLECGHDFHTECIKQWLTQKNLCPICKSTGLST